MPMLRWYGGTRDSGLPSSRIFAGGRRLEPREQHQRRGLSRSRRPEQGQELAPLDIEIETIDDASNAIVGLADA